MLKYLKQLIIRRRAALIAAAVLWLGAASIGLYSGGSGTPYEVEMERAEPSFNLWWEIFSNNSLVALLAFAGILTAGIFTVFYAVVSGLLIGHFIAQAIQLTDPAFVLRTLALHGMLEFSAIIISIAAGLAPLTQLSRRLLGFRNNKPKPLIDSFTKIALDALALLLISLLMLGVAATIETWVIVR